MSKVAPPPPRFPVAPLDGSLPKASNLPAAPANPAPFDRPWEKDGFGGAVLYADNGSTVSQVSGGTTKAAGLQVPADVGQLLDEGAKTKSVKGDFEAVKQAIAKGDYAGAQKAMDTLLRRKEEYVDSDMSAGSVKNAYTVKDQLGFLAQMKAAGVDASYPPTEAQLVSYFKTLKKDPDGARQAFSDYTHAFHIHPANVPGADPDVKYSPDGVTTRKNTDVPTGVPDDWSEVANRPVSDTPGAVGKQMNDCEGFAYMAGKLLGAAGFKLESQLTVHGSPVGEHAMALFSHPGEKGYTVTSNDGVFTGDTKKSAAKQGYSYAVGGDDKLTGKEGYYTGQTMKDSQVNAMTNGPKL